MGIGVISLTTSQKRRQSGPPFAAGSANNGLSVDPVTEVIVLGNDVNDPAQPAILLSDREIVTQDAAFNAFALLLNAINASVVTRLTGDTIQLTGTNAATTSLTIQTDAGGVSTLDIRNITDILTIDAGSSTNAITFSVGQLFPAAWLRVSAVNRSAQMGATLVASNTATLQVTGTLTHRRFLQSQGAGTYNVDRDLDSAKVFRNSGATNFVFPNMVGSNARVGFTVGFNCNNAAGLTITASAGQTIRFGSIATSSGGTLSSTDIGAFCRLTLLDSSTWFTESFNGAWSLT
jgi:hypothetical protein